MSDNYQKLPDNYVGSFGFSIDFDTDFDFTGMSNVVFIIEKPDGSKILRQVDVADYAQGPDLDLVYGRIIAGDLDVAGEYYFQIATYNAGQSIVLFSYQLNMHVHPSSATVSEVLAA